MKKYLSHETYRLLRNCSLLDSGEYEGKRFVRCVPQADVDDKRAMICLAVKECDEPGLVLMSWHEKYGDYLRVDLTSKTYRLICHMKS